MLLRFGRLSVRLHTVVIWRTRYAVFVGSPVDRRLMAAEVVVGRRRRYRPLERGSLPRVLGSPGTFEYAVDKIAEEQKL